MDIGRLTRALEALRYADAWQRYHQAGRMKERDPADARLTMELKWMVRNSG